MATVLSFEQHAMARLRARVAALDEANSDLLTYARSHSGAVAEIHAAALAAMEATSLDHLIHVVTQDWVDILGVDAVALAFADEVNAVRAGLTGVQFVDPAELAPLMRRIPEVTLRAVDEGAAVFGPAAPLIRSEALIRLTPAAPLPVGVLGLGSRQRHSFTGSHGGELLAFLGGVVSRTLARWVAS